MPVRHNAVRRANERPIETPLVKHPAPQITQPVAEQMVTPATTPTAGETRAAAPSNRVPVEVTRDTDIRAIGSVPASVVRGVLDYARSPAMVEFDAVYAAIKDHAVAMLAIMAKETEYGRTANGAKNGWNTIDGASGFTDYPSWDAGARAAMRRLTDPQYKGGVYEQGISVADFIKVWQGGPLCRTSNYKTCAHGETKASIELSISQFLDRANRILTAAANVGPATPTPTPTHPAPTVPPIVVPDDKRVTFGRVPQPSNYAEIIIAPGVNTAFDYLGARKPRGLVLHRMLGTLIGTNSYFQGEARFRACTDFGIGKGADGRRGRVIRWTKPGAGIAPWASGPADGIDGDGTAFWNAYKSDPIGASVFNRDCESFEIEGQYLDPVPADDYQALVEALSWRADGWLRIPYWQWPRNNDGVHCLLGHSEVTDQKECAGAKVYAIVGKLIVDVGARMKRYQVG